MWKRAGHSVMCKREYQAWLKHCRPYVVNENVTITNVYIKLIKLHQHLKDVRFFLLLFFTSVTFLMNSNSSIKQYSCVSWQQNMLLTELFFTMTHPAECFGIRLISVLDRCFQTIHEAAQNICTWNVFVSVCPSRGAGGQHWHGPQCDGVHPLHSWNDRLADIYIGE